MICGLQKMTLLDFPGKIACTVFLGGCNFRCPFCHNSELFMGKPEKLMEDEEFFAFLKSRRGLLDGVCVSGGEPTLYKTLPDFLAKIKEMGFLVKLDTPIAPARHRLPIWIVLFPVLPIVVMS